MSATELAIVLNPDAGSRYDERRVDGLRAIAGSRGVLFSTSKRDLLDAIVQGARERGVATVAIIGGDGTVSSVLSALHRAYGSERLPRIALLRGGSMIVAPDGRVIAGPVLDKEDVVIAELDLSQVRAESMTLDVSGHYSRPDSFEFRTIRHPRPA